MLGQIWAKQAKAFGPQPLEDCLILSLFRTSSVTEDEHSSFSEASASLSHLV